MTASSRYLLDVSGNAPSASEIKDNLEDDYMTFSQDSQS